MQDFQIGFCKISQLTFMMLFSLFKVGRVKPILSKFYHSSIKLPLEAETLAWYVTLAILLFWELGNSFKVQIILDTQIMTASPMNIMLSLLALL